MKRRELTNLYIKVFILLMGHLHTVSAAVHSLKYICTGVSGDLNFPEFTAVALLDNVQFAYFDSNTKTAVPKTEWIKREESVYWDRLTEDAIDAHGFLKDYLQSEGVFNQSMSTGVHTVQVMMGCKWDEETNVTEGFLQFGYDGEDFLSLDLKTLTWIASKPQAVNITFKLDNDKDQNEYWKYELTQECTDSMKRFLDYEKTSLMRTVPPSVSLLQKTPSSPVTCHVTGFYPRGIIVTWKKDGQEQHEDVNMGDTLPNDDGTFQKSVHLNVNPEEWKNNKYQCVVQVSGIKEDLIKVLTEDEIQTNRVPTSMGPIIGGAIAGLLVITAVVIGVVIWKKKSKTGFVPANKQCGTPERRQWTGGRCTYLL